MAKPSLPPRKKGRPVDLETLAGQLADAMAMLETAVNSLEANEGRGGPELSVLERVRKDLDGVYAQLDDAAGGQIAREGGP